MTSVNAFATQLEAFFNIFFVDTHTDTDTDTKALLYPCCACARGVKTLKLPACPFQALSFHLNNLFLDETLTTLGCVHYRRLHLGESRIINIRYVKKPFQFIYKPFLIYIPGIFTTKSNKSALYS